jgi:hypothetical protein
MYINEPYNLVAKYRFIFIKLDLLQINHIHLLFLTKTVSLSVTLPVPLSASDSLLARAECMKAVLCAARRRGGGSRFIFIKLDLRQIKHIHLLFL